MNNTIIRNVFIFAIFALVFISYGVGYYVGRVNGISDAMLVSSSVKMVNSLYQYRMIDEKDIDAVKRSVIYNINGNLEFLVKFIDYSPLEYMKEKKPDSKEIKDLAIETLLATKRHTRGKDIIRPEINDRLNDLIEDLQARGKIENVD